MIHDLIPILCRHSMRYTFAGIRSDSIDDVDGQD